MAGFSVGAGRVEGSVQAVYDGKAGSAALNGYSIGAYWTRRGLSGWYVDAVVQGTIYESVRASSVLGETLDSAGWTFSGSLEAGYPFVLGGGWSIEPQAQLVYQRTALDDGRDRFGLVDYHDADAVFGRLGGRLVKAWTTSERASSRPTSPSLHPPTTSSRSMMAVAMASAAAQG